jgi:SEC-C motif domain protein
MRRPNPPPARCPCGRAAPYADCCGRFLDGGECPDTAEALMRSRYVAQVRGRMDHLHRTWHPSTRPASLDRAGKPVRWLGLNVLRVEAGGAGDAHGTVVFVARYKIGGRAYRLRESSRFVREDGRWFYLDADGAP